MMPTPWVTEVAEYAKKNPNADLGLHLTLNSEWNTYRWGGLAPRDKVASLYDADGTFPRETETVAKRAKLDEVELELRAQIDRAYAIGIKPTHVDSHMYALYGTPELFRTYARVARSYKLPFLGVFDSPTAAIRSELTPTDIVPDAVIMRLQKGTPEEWRKYYLDADPHSQAGADGDPRAPRLRRRGAPRRDGGMGLVGSRLAPAGLRRPDQRGVQAGAEGQRRGAGDVARHSEGDVSDAVRGERSMTGVRILDSLRSLGMT